MENHQERAETVQAFTSMDRHPQPDVFDRGMDHPKENVHHEKEAVRKKTKPGIRHLLNRCENDGLHFFL